MKRRKGKRKAPVSIGEPLGRVLEQAAPRGRRLLAVLDAWRSMVSPRTLSHARPTSIRRGVLYLTVTDPLWMSELTYFVPRFLEALNGALPAGERLKSIRLRVGQLEDMPGTRRRRASEPPPPAPSSLTREVRDRLERIDDPELRDQMARIAAKLGGTKGKSRNPRGRS